MRRIGIAFLIVLGMLIGLVGCGGSGKFLGLDDRQAYVLTSQASLIKVFLKDGTTDGGVIILNAPQGLSSICFRSQTGQLYGMGKDFQVYRVSAVSGVCTVVSPGPLPLTDFRGQLYSSPDGSHLYFIAQDGTTYHINPSSGALVSTGATIAYDPGDPNSGPGVGGATYSAAGGQIWFLDSTNNVLAHIDSPLTGVLTTIGPLGTTVLGQSGLAIDPQLGKLYMTFDSGPNAGLYRINAATGAATQFGGAAVAGESMAIIP